jgi:amino acid permease
MSIPLLFFSLKKNFLNTIILFRRGSSKKQAIDNQTNGLLLKNENNEGKNDLKISETSKNIITVILYLSLCVVTITVKYMGEIFDVIGSTAANAINFIFPNLFLLKLTHTILFSKKFVLSQILCVTGFFVLVLCFISEILKLAGVQQES